MPYWLFTLHNGLVILSCNVIFNGIIVFLAPKNIGIDTKIFKFELIVTDLWSFRGVGGHV